MKYTGVGLSGEMTIDNSNGKFSSTNLDEILEEIYIARSSGGGGTTQSDEWILHESYIFNGVQTWRDLPTAWTDIKFIFLENGDSTVLYYDQYIDFIKAELIELDGLGYTDDGGWYQHVVLIDESEQALDMQLDVNGNRYLVMSSDTDNAILVFYKNLI